MAIQSTGTLSAAGVGSGLDVGTLVSKLMAVERQPETAMDNQTTAYKAQLSAYGTLSSSLASLQTAASAVNRLSTLNATAVNVADSGIASASAAPGTAPGTYSLVVQNLAQAQQLATPAFASVTSPVGTGTLTIDFGTYSAGAFSLNPSKTSATVTIGARQNSVAGVRDAINASNTGVTASIVDDGSGQRLVIASKDTGLASALRIRAADDDGNDTDNAGLSRLAYDASAGGVTNLAQVNPAADASITVNGIGVTRSGNSVADAIPGVTLNLLRAAPGTPTAVTVSRDTATASAAVTALVTAYNSAAATIGKLSAYDAATKTSATLQGDSTLIGIQSQMRALLGGAVTNASGYTNIADLGLSFQRDGTLQADPTVLNRALNDSARNAASVLATVGTPSDSLVQYVTATSAAESGAYAVQVTQLATRGVLSGSTPAALTITAGVNDTLSLSVDGTAATVTLAAGTYTPASLGAMLQSRINGDPALVTAGNSITVASAGGILAMTSDRWGSSSQVAITGGNAAADLFGTPAATAGLDVAGTLGGVTATGAGQSLTAKGITVSVLGGSVGARGTLNFSRGLADSLGTMIGNFLTGSLAARTGSIQASMSGVAAQKAAFETRMTDVQAAMTKQFQALDIAITSMQNTTSFLTQALASLPKVTE